jgi:SOS-response transcriptional repressor LexA
MEAIESLTAATGQPPTYRELATKRNLSIGGIQTHLDLLAGIGMVSFTNKPRSLKVTDSTDQPWEIVCQTKIDRTNQAAKFDVVLAAVTADLQSLYHSTDMFDRDIEITIRARS